MKWIIITGAVVLAVAIVRSLVRSARREWFIGDIVMRYLVGKHLGWSADEIASRIRKLYAIRSTEPLTAMDPRFDKLCAGGISANPTSDERDELNMGQLAEEVLQERGLLRKFELSVRKFKPSELRANGKQAAFLGERVLYHISITPTVLAKRPRRTMAEFAERLKW